MEVAHIYAKSSIEKIEFDTSKLPTKVGLATTIQHIHELPRVQAFLASKNKEGVIAGQVLGCYQVGAMKVNDQVDAFLYIGSGQFHPLGLAINSGKPVFKWNPLGKEITEVTQEEVDKILKRKKGLLLKFLTSNEIGVLISTKSGQRTVQSSLKNTFGLEEKYPDKKFYWFACNTLEFNELENYPFIGAWINTMCPRIREDLGVLNIEDLKDLGN